MTSPRRSSRWLLAAIQGGAAFFIVALVVSAVFDPTIRVLHALQALIYVAVIVLVRRDRAWGFGAGFTIALLWNYTNLFVTTFIAAGLRELATLLQTGHLHRPDRIRRPGEGCWNRASEATRAEEGRAALLRQGEISSAAGCTRGGKGRSSR